MPSARTYGARPRALGPFRLSQHWDEYMHYMYLPVKIDEQYSLPPALGFASLLVPALIKHEEIYRDYDRLPHWRYVYVTARRGYATPGNPLNRPGWHTDGFGGEDVNYVWTNRYPTLFAEQEFHGISDDHVRSAEQFTEQVRADQLVTYPDEWLLRLDQFVVHAAPEIPAPGGERSFFKVSFSNERYNLRGNSHNHGLDYDWPMYDRAVIRNDPARAGGDTGDVR